MYLLLFKIVVILYYIQTLFVLNLEASSIPINERNALIDLYHSAGGPNWYNKEGWLSKTIDPCKWHGISCTQSLDDSFRHVNNVELAQNNLIGTLPESIGQLNHMYFLAMDIGDQLTGPLPKSIGNLTGMVLFTIEQDHLSGPIPEEFCKLTSLVVFHGGYNNFTSIPDCFCDLPLSTMQSCALSGNPITGNCPACAKKYCDAPCN